MNAPDTIDAIKLRDAVKKARWAYVDGGGPHLVIPFQESWVVADLLDLDQLDMANWMDFE